jgi:hypothetical protein
MEATWQADRTALRMLLRIHPDWTNQDLADTLHRSRGWVKKWRTRLRSASPDDPTIICSRSRARIHPSATVHPTVVERILEIRDHPPEGLQRIPGPKAIQYYLQRDSTLREQALPVPGSSSTIWRILRRHSRITEPTTRRRRSIERAEPMSSWQLDFKDASTVPADVEGKQQHVVEVLDVVDAGTSILVAAEVREDFNAETTLETMAQVVQTHGLPQQITIDRDVRFVGSPSMRDFPSAFVRFWLCLDVQVNICPPRRPDKNPFVERYHRTYEYECLRVFRPTDVARVKDVTALFQHHYNEQRPHQGLACQNQPPRLAFPNLPMLPKVPTLVDPDRWLQIIDGQRYERKVRSDTSVTLDGVAYYLSRDLIGKVVALRVDAAQKELVVEDAGREVKRVAIKGLGSPAMPFEAYVARMGVEARSERLLGHTFGQQLRLPI